MSGAGCVCRGPCVNVNRAGWVSGLGPLRRSAFEAAAELQQPGDADRCQGDHRQAVCTAGRGRDAGNENRAGDGRSEEEPRLEILRDSPEISPC